MFKMLIKEIKLMLGANKKPISLDTHVRKSVCVCVCVCEREREREKVILHL